MKGSMVLVFDLRTKDNNVLAEGKVARIEGGQIGNKECCEILLDTGFKIRIFSEKLSKMAKEEAL